MTRRKGWAFLKPGDRFCAIVKGQGLKAGEKVKRLAILECVSNRPEPLESIVDWPSRCDLSGRWEVEREGFPEMSEEDFVAMFRRSIGPIETVNRIEFKEIERLG